MPTDELRILVHDRLQAGKYADLLRQLGWTGPIARAANADELAAALPGADVLLGTPAGLPAGALRQAGHLRLIHSVWAGVDGWLPLEPPAHVPLVRMTRIFGTPIAEYVLGHILAQKLQVHRMRASQAERRWDPFAPDLLAGKTMGIAGAGEIGSAIARRAAAFGMRVWGLGRRPRTAEPPVERYFTCQELDAFLPGLDYLVLVLPKTEETRAMFGAEALARLKRTAWVINVGRGHTLDEAALAAALREGRLGGAILDVFQTEPLPADSPLWDLPNAVITPHYSGITVPEAAVQVIWENLQRLQRGEPLFGVVDRAAGY